MSHKNKNKEKISKSKSLSIVGVFFLLLSLFLFTIFNIFNVVPDNDLVSYYEVDQNINFDDYEPSINYTTGKYAKVNYDNRSTNNLLSQAAVSKSNVAASIESLYTKYGLNISKYQYLVAMDVEYFMSGIVSMDQMESRVKLLSIKQKSRAKASVTAVYKNMNLDHSIGQYDSYIQSLFNGEKSISTIKSELKVVSVEILDEEVMPSVVVEFPSAPLKSIDPQVEITEKKQVEEKKAVKTIEAVNINELSYIDTDCRVFIGDVEFTLNPCQVSAEMMDSEGDETLEFSIETGNNEVSYSYAIYGYGVGFPKYGIYGGTESGIADGKASIIKYFNDEIIKAGIYEGYLRVGVRLGEVEKEMNLFVNLHVGSITEEEEIVCEWESVSKTILSELEGECQCGEEFNGFICAER